MQNYVIKNQEKLENSEIEVLIESPFGELEKHRAKALKAMLQDVELDGFRKGKVPEDIFIKRYGEVAVLYEAAGVLIQEILPQLLTELKLKIIGEPGITITKCASGNPLEFKVRLAILPEVKLPDYKKIASTENSKKPEAIKVEEKEIDEVVSFFRHQVLHQNLKAEGKEEPKGEHHHEDKDLPVFDDEFVKKLGNFKDVVDFRGQIAKNIEQDKIVKAKDAKRLTIIENISTKTDLPIPKVLVDNELNKMEAQLRHDIEKTGLKADDYLKHIKKTWEEMRKEWQPEALKRAKMELILFEISEQEKLAPTKEELEAETKRMLEHYKDASPDRVRAYLETALTNQKVFDFLESQK
ncbi:MAG: trigger factor [Candidatus Paceibacterota bacterium]|jgi:trigger factor